MKPLLAALLLFPAALAQEVRVYVSSEAGDRLSAKPAIHFAENRPGGIRFRVDERARHQEIAGFGASFLEAGMICLHSLAPAEQEKVLQALFDPEHGAGFTAMKTVIAGTDFMSAGPWYTYDDVPGDTALEHFSIHRDLGPNGLVPYIRRARRYGSFLLEAPMDYPPDWMLVDLKKRQDVQPRYYDALARYYLRYLREYEKQGIAIDYLSPFNEPGIYTKIPYTAIRELVRDHIGPLFKKERIATRLMTPEPPERADAWKNLPVLLDDAGARQYISVLAYHGYQYKDYPKIKELGERYHLPVWMTEVCHAYEAGTPRSIPLPNYAFADGDFWGNQIFNDLENDAAVWIYWNMILDEHGGPWLVSPIHGNPADNPQHPVVIVNRRTHQVTYTGLYYYLAHLSKFVRPGSVRLGVEGGEKSVRCLVFRGRDGQLVAELMNSRPAAVEAAVEFAGRAVTVPLPALSITTCLWK